MCLTINANIHQQTDGSYSPCVAPADITVWKVLKKYSDGEYATPYQDNSVRFNRSGEAVLKRASGKLDNRKSSTVESGGFHAYTRYEAALNMVMEAKKNPGGDYWIVKGKVPRGTKYFIGMHMDIVAEKLKLDLDGRL